MSIRHPQVCGPREGAVREMRGLARRASQVTSIYQQSWLTGEVPELPEGN